MLPEAVNFWRNLWRRAAARTLSPIAPPWKWKSMPLDKNWVVWLMFLSGLVALVRVLEIRD